MQADAPSFTEETFTVADILRFLRAHVRLLAATTVAGALLAGSVAWLMTPMFRAEVTVTEAAGGPLDGPRFGDQLSGLASLAGVNLQGGSGQSAERRAILESTMLAQAFVTQHSLDKVLHKEPRSTWMAVREFRKRILAIKEDSRTGLIRVSVDWSDPRVAAEWANGYVALANETIRQRDIANSQRNLAFLKDQIDKTGLVDLQKILFSLVENETKALMLASSRSDYAFAVVDPAIPPEVKVRPARVLIIVLGCIAGLLAGAAFAFVRDMLRSPRVG